jgi:hypothetical protein
VEAGSERLATAYSLRFHHTFKEPLSSSKRAAMRELFPAGSRRGPVADLEDC